MENDQKELLIGQLKSEIFQWQQVDKDFIELKK
jgi:hypothetical protein